MRAPKLLTVIAAVLLVPTVGSAARAAEGDATASTASKPPVSTSGATVTVEANSSTVGSQGSTSTTAVPVVDPCSEARAYGPAVGGSGLMVPLVVDNGGKRYAVYMRTCVGDPNGQIRWYQIHTPEELAEIAADRVRRLLPETKPVFADPTAPWQFVKVPTIVWVDPAGWQPFTATATALETWTTVTVVPVRDAVRSGRR